MGTRRGQSTGWQLAVLLIVILAGIALVSWATSALPSHRGVGADAIVKELQPGVRGYVHPARLMSEHPLYGELQRLDSEISRLSLAPHASWEYDWSGLSKFDMRHTLIAPAIPEPYKAHLDQYQREWREQLKQRVPHASDELAEDLRARLQWSEQGLRTDLDAKLAAAQHSQELQLARKRAELVRTYQEALMNADLFPRALVDGEQSGPTERERIMARIEAEMVKEKQASERLLAEYDAKMRDEAQVAFVTAQQEVWELMQKRLESSVTSGSKIAAGLSKYLSKPDSQDFSADSIEWDPGDSAAFWEENGDSASEFDDLYAAACQRVAEALSRQRSALSREIYDETVLAIRKCDFEVGAELTISPTDPEFGEDLTESVRPLLRRMWQHEG